MHQIASVEPNKKGDSFLIRLVYIGGMIAIGTLLTVTGWQAISKRSYDFDWTVSDGSKSSTSDERSTTSHEHLQEQDAVLHGIGLFCGGLLLYLWSLIILWNAGPWPLGLEWSWIHSLLTLISLLILVVGVVGIYPPWHIGPWGSCDGVYMVFLASLWFVPIRDPKKLKYWGERIYPGLITIAVFGGSIWPGLGAGIIAGIFLTLGLAAHVLLLIPASRAVFWNSPLK
jgi:hypothetical protein